MPSKAEEQESQRTTNAVTNPLTATNQTETTARTHHPSSPAPQALLQKGFVEKDKGVYQKKQISLTEARTLLNFDTSDMRPIPSCPPTERSYWVALEKGVCVITIPTGPNDTNATVLVDLVINTNAIPVGRKLTPRQTPTNNVKPSAGVEMR